MKSIVKIFFLQLLFSTGLLAQQEEFGLASFYSDLFHGKPTASGELYDKSKLTCAHKTLPFGTILKVTRLDNNQSVEVKVNDRGPFISGRVVEISKAAADKIGLVKDGSTKVKVQVASSQKATEATAAKTEPLPKSAETPVTVEKKAEKPAEKAKDASAEKGKAASEKEKPAAKPAAAEKEKPAAKPVSAEKSAPVNQKPAAVDKKETTSKGAGKVPSDYGKAVKVKGSDYQVNDLYQIELKRPEKKGFAVQVAVLSSQDALFKKIAELQEDWFDNILVSVQSGPKGEMQYKLFLGSFPTEPEASNYKVALKKKKIDGFVVDLSNLGKEK